LKVERIEAAKIKLQDEKRRLLLEKQQLLKDARKKIVQDRPAIGGQSMIGENREFMIGSPERGIRLPKQGASSTVTSPKNGEGRNNKGASILMKKAISA
jgi:hypothetical protein